MSDKIAYTLTDSGDLDSEQWAIHIDSGKYEGVIYQYGVISAREDGDMAKVEFTYSVVDNNDIDLTKDTQEFELTLGSILHEILIEMAEENNGQNGSDNPKESRTQRRVHEESISVSEE